MSLSQIGAYMLDGNLQCEACAELLAEHAEAAPTPIPYEELLAAFESGGLLCDGCGVILIEDTSLSTSNEDES